MDLERRESDYDVVVDVAGSDVVGDESSTVIPFDIGIKDGVVTVSDVVVSVVVVDVVAEEYVPIVHGEYDVVGR